MKIDLKKMSQDEKHKFCDMDMAERIIRVEQRVSAKFNKYIPYNETEYFKGMCEKDKEAFQKFIQGKKRNKLVLAGISLIPLAILGLLKINFTGNVVAENLSSSANEFLSFGMIGLFLAIVIFMLFKAYSNRDTDKRRSSHESVVDNYLVNRGMTKKF